MAGGRLGLPNFLLEQSVCSAVSAAAANSIRFWSLAGLSPLFGSRRRLISRIRDRAEALSTWTDASLRRHCQTLAQPRSTSNDRRPPDPPITETIAIAAESVRRATGKTFYDVQLSAGIALCRGRIAEVQTGEGKTLITAIAAIDGAIRDSAATGANRGNVRFAQGGGVHVMTTNEYLSDRDHDALRPAYRLLGLTSGHLTADMTDDEKRAVYRKSIVYAAGEQFGFDYLRDQIRARGNVDRTLGCDYLSAVAGHHFVTHRPLQRGRGVAIVDEADSVLIDQASTPLILSGPDPSPQTAPAMYRYAAEIAESMIQGEHYDRPRSSVVQWTEAGLDAAAKTFAGRPPGRLVRPWPAMVMSAIQARVAFARDIDYVVVDDQVRIVDPHTGRIHQHRRWQSGLHQAIEVAEGLPPTPETLTQARITRQRYSSLYRRRCGLTGTATDASRDFADFYRLRVEAIPPHRPCRRVVCPTLYFANTDQKESAIVRDAVARARRGQPVLIGTASIQTSRRIAAELRNTLSGDDQTTPLPQPTLLNGTQDRDEADIVAGAGRPGQITIATNMAGRGTDIAVAPPSLAAGGLHVIAPEHQRSARIDRQLAGRAARQGQIGSVQFFAAADDPLIAERDKNLAAAIARLPATDQGHRRPAFDGRIKQIQRRSDRDQFTSRQTMVARDRWLETIQNTMARRAA